MLAARLLERLLEDAAGSRALRCVDDPALAEPERDVVRLSRWPLLFASAIRSGGIAAFE